MRKIELPWCIEHPRKVAIPTLRSISRYNKHSRRMIFTERNNSIFVRWPFKRLNDLENYHAYLSLKSYDYKRNEIMKIMSSLLYCTWMISCSKMWKFINNETILRDSSLQTSIELLGFARKHFAALSHLIVKSFRVRAIKRARVDSYQGKRVRERRARAVNGMREKRTCSLRWPRRIQPQDMDHPERLMMQNRWTAAAAAEKRAIRKRITSRRARICIFAHEKPRWQARWFTWLAWIMSLKILYISVWQLDRRI